ncbi:hypothetical protein [Rhodopirellula baltica]|uniref:Uncharacterized protein n=1 Tax=Rhodopirellula baltica SWK14 TaxID=993516 RepID=L7CG59_RHOBT|nr:hypothetical protein [Rhodopirellula baltica]ELP32046.1 hypothetical protein RBSWK_04044 [Rhodopirellula baltica SWK14]
MYAFASGFSGRPRTLGKLDKDEIIAQLELREKEDKAFWASPKIEATIAVELPFWMMLDSCQINVEVGDCPATATIHQKLVGFYDGEFCLDSRNNMVAVSLDGQVLTVSERRRLQSIKVITKRPMKTTIEFDVKVHKRVLVDWMRRNELPADSGSGVRAVNRSMQYMAALAYAHLPFVNRVISSYRSTSFDPFAFEVSEWDLPVWYIESESEFCVVGIMPYHSIDSPPSVAAFGSEDQHPYFSTNVGEVQAQCERELAPGKLQILDAKSLLIRGRYAESIRSAVTAIEVAVEARLVGLLRQSGRSDEEVYDELDDTKMNFFERMRRLQILLGRRVPGPHVFSDWMNDDPECPLLAPYLNGVRLLRELSWVRQIRHDVVHRGVSISIFDRGPALRAVETMTRLFQWLDPGSDFADESTRDYAYYGTLRGHFTEQASFTTAGVQMEERDIEDRDIVFPKQYLKEMYVNSLSAEDYDVDLFAAMTLAALDVALEDSDPTEVTSRLDHEQFVVRLRDRETLVFCLEAGTRLDQETVTRLIQRKRQAEIDSGRRLHALVFMANVQALVETEMPSRALLELIGSIELAGLTIVDCNRVLRSVFALDDLAWSKEMILERLLHHGYSDCMPGEYVGIGKVRRPLPKHSAVSVSVSAGREFERGDTLMFMSSNQVVEFVPLSIEIAHESVEKVTGPVDVGVGLPEGAVMPDTGWRVYRKRNVIA